MNDRGPKGPDNQPTASLPGAAPHSSAPTAGLPAGTEPGPGGAPLVFSSGTLVAGRYRIRRFIAAGGMGEVYEAEDLELGARVALKTLRPRIADTPGALEHFKQEIALARKVTHRNVCRIFDVGWHLESSPAPSKPQGPGVAFLTMEFLEGENLSDLLRREGPIPPSRAMPIFRQMAEALAAAHGAGVIHRDFKAGNVVLEPTGDGYRAVVTDFGLARSGSTGDTAASGDIVGTPAYMAPEQLQGGRVTPATDVYAFGVVMCEVLLGRRPFSGDGSLATAMDRLKRGDTAPDLRGARLGRRWEPVVVRCLQSEASRRYAEGALLLAALDEAAGTASRRRLTLGIGAVVAAAVLGSGLLTAYLMKGRPHAPAGHAVTAAKTPRRSVAVLGFKNLSGKPEDAWLSTALEEMLSTELAAGEHLRIVPGETVSRMKRDLGLSDVETLAPDTLARVRANLGADFVVLGSYVALGGGGGSSIRLDLRLQDAGAGETLASIAESGTESRLFEMAADAGAALRGKLGVGPVTPVEAAAAQAAAPADPRAARLYAEGLSRLRRLEVNDAVRLFQGTIAVDPAFSLAHSALAQAWTDLGYDARALQEAKAAFDRSASLPKEQRMVVEARYRETAGEWDKALDLYRALWGFFPDNLEYGLLLAHAQSRAGRGKDALGTVAELRSLPAPAAGDPRVDIAAAEAAQALSDWKGMQEAAARSAAAAGRLGARLVVARAKTFEAQAWRKLGDSARALAAADEARRAYEAAGDPYGAADAERVTVYVLSAQGDVKGAQALAAKLLRTYRSLGNQRGAAMMLNALANAAYAEGDLKSAAASYEECLRVLKETDDAAGACRASSNLANVLLLQGDSAGARRRHEEALALAREVGDKSAQAYALCALGEIGLGEGDIALASAHYGDSLALFRETGERSGEAYALYGLGEVRVAQDMLDEAARLHGEALALREKLGEVSAAGESRLALANVDLQRGGAEKSEASALALLKGFETDGLEDERALAWDLVARARLARKDPAGALAAARKAEALSRGNEDRPLQLAVALTAARARGASGDVAGARKAMDSILDASGRAGRQDLALRARLALGELELAAGRRAEGRATLEALKKEASARGFALVARQTGAALAP